MEKTKADLDNEQISATRTPKMEPECSKWLRRTSKKGPRSRQCRHLGNRRYLRKQKRPQRVPMGRPNGPQVAIGDEKEANMGPIRLQKGVRKGSKSETLEKLKIELSPG